LFCSRSLSVWPVGSKAKEKETKVKLQVALNALLSYAMLCYALLSYALLSSLRPVPFAS
jgi:hypothetical protein